ncbi:hypothetical protein P879_10783 [Paragonimus westermani]|uniref:Uncharacterized protein n=1 Tax=Paragonimus westermani TaxID=34504 RepID=A0A8T0D981_9TREM|nr:hypothetical protein P879_10783 [Paragonimus westermani]
MCVVDFPGNEHLKANIPALSDLRKKPLLKVYNILFNPSISYIIIENSICFAESTGCAENDIIDLDNKQWPDLWITNASIQSTGQLNVAYRLDEPARQLLRKPDQNTKRFCADVFQLFATTASHNIELQKQRTPIFQTCVQKLNILYFYRFPTIPHLMMTERDISPLDVCYRLLLNFLF